MRKNIEELIVNSVENPADGNIFSLSLFITGATPNSLRAVANIKAVCDKYLPGKYHLEIIDVYKYKDVAEQEQIVALPMLIKKFPLPVRRLIGDMSNTAKVLEALGVKQ